MKRPVFIASLLGVGICAVLLYVSHVSSEGRGNGRNAVAAGTEERTMTASDTEKEETQMPRPARGAASSREAASAQNGNTKAPSATDTPAGNAPGGMDVDLPMPDWGNGALPTDLSAAETEQAKSVFMEERAMWKRLRSLKGNMEVSILEKDENGVEIVKLRVQGEVDLQLKRENDAQKKKAWPFQNAMRFTAAANRIVFISDGTSEGTRLKCDEESLASQVPSVLNKDLLLITLYPQIALLPTMSDEVFPDTRMRKDDFFAAFAPWRNRGAIGAPGSFVFDDKYYARKGTQLAFTQGHISEVHSAWGERVQFKAPVESNGFWFPTEVTYSRPNAPTRRIKFTNIQVGTDAARRE